MANSVVGTASGERIYVIGDIHGCPDEPSLLLEYLVEKEKLSSNDLVLFLGDYIDRGPDTKAVISRLLEFRLQFSNVRFLKGNHEDMLLDFLGYGGRLGEAFLYNGGLETMESYGISVFSPPEEMVQAMPPEHFQFLYELESIVRIEPNFVCCHAGVNPLKALEEQHDDEVLWIRDEFIANIHRFDFTVLFGHTPHQEIFTHMPYKIGLDTGLVFGNKLTCLEIQSGKVFQIMRGACKVTKSKLDMSQVFAKEK